MSAFGSRLAQPKGVEAGATVTIVSSDKDLIQLVGPGVTMLDPIKRKLIGPDECGRNSASGRSG